MNEFPSPDPFGSRAECSGIPGACPHAAQRIMGAAEGVPDPARIGALRRELEHCAPCVANFDVQLNVQSLVALHCREQAPESLRIRISETLERIDLSQIDVTDL
ncbi:MAG: hypothetical protein F4236_02805 [Acidimicrobiia bacterium]|nr:hypothetical protein [Acidimicrobiia bacterium]MYB25062.1 hypothetical protein [Acidimicrobiia bacterium]MYE67123.1 hypothetical protein [Acidimicrobiia bacterium]MYJ13698.1 hypothetical protein [Acidimicrobiia bacterium]